MLFQLLTITCLLVLSGHCSPSTERPCDQPDFPFYPETCCQLKWVNIFANELLPDDYILAGEFQNRSYAFTMTSIRSSAVKSDQRREEPNWLDKSVRVNPYPILTNPNNCTIGWYMKRFIKEEIPTRKDWFFPTLQLKTLGDFARHEGVPGRLDEKGLFARMSEPSGEHFNWQELKWVELMYVDCYKSIPSMSEAVLVNITMDDEDILRVQNSRTVVTNTKKIVVNNSPEPMNSFVNFEYETFDNVSMRLKKSHGSYFGTTDETYRSWTVGGGISLTFGFLGLNFGASFTSSDWNTRTDMKFKFEETEIFQTSSSRKFFGFSQDVYVPPFSKTILTALSKPIRGDIPITAVYELTPVGVSRDILLKTLRKYGLDKNVEPTTNGTLLVTLTGFIKADGGHEVDVDIQTVQLNGTQFM